MKFVNSKFAIVLASLIIILAIISNNIKSSEVVSKAHSHSESKTNTKLKNKTNSKMKFMTKLKKNYSFDLPPGASQEVSDQSKKNNLSLNKILDSDQSRDIILNDWLMITSSTFRNSAVFPEILNGYTSESLKIKTDENNYRLNDAHEKDKDKHILPAQDKLFWFRLSKELIFYSSTKHDLNILGGHKIDHIVDAVSLHKNESGFYCFTIIDKSGHDWKICSDEEKVRNKWFCQIQTIREKPLEKYCSGIDENANIVYKNIVQPLIIIPIPSRKCNELWNYQNHGEDWECDCSEGREQSPIDLPVKDKAIDSNVSPLFKFSETKPIVIKSMENGVPRETETLKFKLEENNLRIKHSKFGKTITPDGSIYDAEEIVIHTPAEHQINGQKYDMEVQIIHYGKSVGDIGKQLILSFLFEKKAGVYNKFIDDLDFFNLPNPLSPVVDISHDLFIPKILYTSDDKETPKMKQFSFYTYQGSLTAPPCSEDTIVYVASKPIEIGTTALHLFQEALRAPDLINEKGDITVSDWIPISNRNIQPLHGRPVFHYDHEKNCGPDKKKSEEDIGHYEKIKKITTKYFYVPGEKVSGVPNAFVVSKNEAMGVRSDIGPRN